MTALRVYTEYSMLYGECRISHLAKRASELSYTSVAKTDVSTLAGSLEFSEYAKKENINPIIGFEGETYIKGEKITLLFLAKNNYGLASLNVLSSFSMTEGTIPFEAIGKYSKGVVGIILNLDIINDYIVQSVLSAFKECLQDFYIGLERCPDESTEKTEKLYSIGIKNSVKCVIANPVFMTEEKGAETLSLLYFIQNGANSEASVNNFYYLHHPSETKGLFAHLPDVWETTEEVGRMCKAEFETGKFNLPTFPTENADSLLKEKAFLGLETILEAVTNSKPSLANGETANSLHLKYVSRLENELETISQMGFSDYFLITADFVSYAKSKNIPVGPGRGSGVGSLVAFCLGITSVDPVENNLIFERFLNPERVSMPDFDIDLGDERRNEVIDYLKQKYGKKFVYGIANYSEFAFRQCIRDVGKYLKKDVSHIIKEIPDKIGITVDEALKQSEGLRKITELGESNRNVLRLCKLLEGRPRAFSPHPSGIALTPKPTVSFSPIMNWENTNITQYSMNTLSKLGILKIDLLGIKFLTVINKTKEYIKSKITDGYPLTESFPPSDPEVFQMLSNGDSAGVFQLEGFGMRELLKKLKPQNIAELTAVISLYRPGPMAFIDDYINGKNFPEKVVYPIEETKNALEETYGCPIYQEQIMQICKDVAGFSLGQADLIRRAMAKKDISQMEKERSTFISGCAKKGISENDASKLFEKICGFSKYAFNKSHGVAYALLAYETAYLKCKYPKEYFASRLDSVAGQLIKIGEYDGELRKFGTRILPPCVNTSDVVFTPKENGVEYSLSAIKGVGDGGAKMIVDERQKNGIFKDADDFLSRVGCAMGSNAAAALAKSGALDVFGETRSTMVNLCNDNLSLGITQRKNDNQFSLFSDDDVIKYQRRPEKEYEETTLRLFEKEYTGVSFGNEEKHYVLYIKITSRNETFLPIATNLLCKNGGNDEVRIYYENSGKTLRLKNASFVPSMQTIEELEQILGEGNIKLTALERKMQ